MSILKKGKKFNFTRERPDLTEIESNGARISISPTQMTVLAAGHSVSSLFDQLSQRGLSPYEMGVRGQSGFGNTVVVKEGGYELESYMYDINNGINNLNRRKVSLFGYSFAGYFSLAYAIQNPSRVSSLILIEPGWEVDSIELKKRAKLSRSKNGLQGLETMLDYVKPNLSKAAKTEMAKMISRDWQSNEAIAQSYLVRAENPITKADMSSVKVPTLLICGSESNVKESTYKAASLIPNATLWCVKGADHLSLENDSRCGGEMADVISNFIKHNG